MGRTSFSPKYSCHCWIKFIVIFVGMILYSSESAGWLIFQLPPSCPVVGGILKVSFSESDCRPCYWPQVSRWGALAAWFSQNNCRQMATVTMCTVVAFRVIHHEPLCSALQNKKLLDLNSRSLKPCLSVVKAVTATCVYTGKLAFS